LLQGIYLFVKVFIHVGFEHPIPVMRNRMQDVSIGSIGTQIRSEKKEKRYGKHAHNILCLCLADFCLRARRMPLAGKFENGIHDAPGFPKTGSSCFQEQGTVLQRAGMRKKRHDVFRNLRDFRLSQGRGRGGGRKHEV